MPSSAANSRMLIGSLKRILISLIARAMEFSAVPCMTKRLRNSPTPLKISMYKISFIAKRPACFRLAGSRRSKEMSLETASAIS